MSSIQDKTLAMKEEIEKQNRDARLLQQRREAAFITKELEHGDDKDIKPVLTKRDLLISKKEEIEKQLRAIQQELGMTQKTLRDLLEKHLPEAVRVM